MSVCVLLPAYNEAEAIGDLLDQLVSLSCSVLVVDDGSRDGTGEIARQKGAAVLSNAVNCGKGAALKKGFAYLLEQPGWDIVVTMDSDGQHDPMEVVKFVCAHRVGGADVAVGNRMANTKKMPWLRAVTNRVTSRCVSSLSGQRIQDSQCGFRSLRRHVLESLTLMCSRFDLESEMLIQAGVQGFKIMSVPIRTIYGRRQPSRIRPVPDTLRFLKLVIKYRCGFKSKREGF